MSSSPALDVWEAGGVRLNPGAMGPVGFPRSFDCGSVEFDELLAEAARCAPGHEVVDVLDVDITMAFLCSPFAKPLTSRTIYASA